MEAIWWRPTGKYTVEVEHLETDPRYQNTGLGEALLREFAANLQTLYPEARFVTGLSVAAAKVRVFRARAKLAALLNANTGERT